MHEREREKDIQELLLEESAEAAAWGGGGISPSISVAVSDAEGGPAGHSAFETPRRQQMHTAFAQRKPGLYGTPSGTGSMSAGRNSWKKSWGREPPGWSSRAAHIEVIALDYPESTTKNVRDVFSGAKAAAGDAGGDESDWVDEDDEDVDDFARGFGQVGRRGTSTNAGNANAGNFKRGGAATSSGGPASAGGRSSPIVGPTSLPPLLLQQPPLSGAAADHMKGEGLMPNARRGAIATNSFKDPIVEADEDEEED